MIYVFFRFSSFTFTENEPDTVIGGGERFNVVFVLNVDRLPRDHK